jgi:hypothetical protein
VTLTDGLFVGVCLFVCLFVVRLSGCFAGDPHVRVGSARHCGKWHVWDDPSSALERRPRRRSQSRTTKRRLGRRDPVLPALVTASKHCSGTAAGQTPACPASCLYVCCPAACSLSVALLLFVYLDALWHRQALGITDASIADASGSALVMELCVAPLASMFLHWEAMLPTTAVYSQLLTVLIQVAAAVSHMHRQRWIHRDIRLANVLVSSKG